MRSLAEPQFAAVSLLSPEQSLAVRARERQVLVLAGAGTGKTRVIVERYRSLIDSGLPSSALLVCSFSERSAAELARRISAATGTPDHVSTLHAFALRVVRDCCQGPGAGDIAIADFATQWSTMVACLAESGEDPDELERAGLYTAPQPESAVPSLLALADYASQRLLDPHEAAETAGGFIDPAPRDLVARIIGRYREALAAAGLTTYERAVEVAVQTLAAAPRIRASFVEVLVDEYQDTSPAQRSLIEMAAGEGGGIFAVADQDQAIYGFRGGDAKAVDHFVAAHPDAGVYPLAGNQRSAAAVVDLANRTLGRRKLVALRPGGTVTLTAAPTGAAEVATVTAAVGRLLREGAPASSIAVLARTNTMAHAFARDLAGAGIEVEVAGGRGFWADPAIADAIALLRIAAGQGDDLDVFRILRSPGVGATDDEVRGLTDRRQEMSLQGCLAHLPAVAAPSLRRAAALLAAMTADEAGGPVTQVARRVLGHWAAALPAPHGAVAASAAARLVERIATDAAASLPDVVERFTLAARASDQDSLRPATGNAVSVMTAHQSKGLEFDHVFLPGLVEGRFPGPSHGPAHAFGPSPASADRMEHLAEERRLFYVACTRAREGLHLSFAHRYDGPKLWKPSRFLADCEALAAAQEVGPAATEALSTPIRPEPASPATSPLAAETPLLTAADVVLLERCGHAYELHRRFGLVGEGGAELDLGILVHATFERCATPEGAVAEFARLFAASSLARDRHATAWRRYGESVVRSIASQVQPSPGRWLTAAGDGWRLRVRADGRSQAPESSRPVDIRSGRLPSAGELRREVGVQALAVAQAQAAGADAAEVEVVGGDGQAQIVAFDAAALEAARERFAAAARKSSGPLTATKDPWTCRSCGLRRACRDRAG